MTIEVTEIGFLNAYNIDLALKSVFFKAKSYLTVSISVVVVKVEAEAILVVVDIISIG